MASSIFGGIANAIDGGPKLNRISYSSTLDDQLGQLTAGQTANRAANAADLARLNAAAIAAAGDVSKLSAGDQALIQQIISERQDPFQTYTNVGNYNIGLLNNLSANLADQGRAGESRRMAALGYGGQGGSTYQSNTLLDRISKNLAPVYANTIATTGRDATAIDASRLAQNQNTLGLLDYRANIPGRELNYLGIPIQARQSLTDSEIANLLGLGNAYQSNTAGFREKQTALGSIGSALDSVVDTGLSIYTGGLAGGSGPTSSAAPKFTASAPTNFGPSGYGNYGVSYTGAPLSAGANFGPSGYGAGMSYSQPGAWTPPWKG